LKDNIINSKQRNNFEHDPVRWTQSKEFYYRIFYNVARAINNVSNENYYIKQNILYKILLLEDIIT